jgi:hypothetical protein
MLDEISSADMDKIRGFLRHRALASSLENIYWQEIPAGLYDRTQIAHEDCAPYVFAIETGRDWVKFELFVRSREILRCDCQGYCTPEQKDFILNFADQMLEACAVGT